MSAKATWGGPGGACVCALAVVLAAMAPAPARAAPAQYVIEVTIDGLGSSYLQALIAENKLPNFQRLQNQGAWTLSARCDYDISVTLPNHVSMVTGRGVNGTGSNGHNWSDNTGVYYPPTSDTTIHSSRGSYVYSAFDVAHGAGLTALVSGKIKLSLIDESYNEYHGILGDTITYSSIPSAADDTTAAARISTFVTQMAATPFKYSLVHIVDPDKAGSWGSTAYNNSVIAADGYLGQILKLIDTNTSLKGKTALIVTADHGGEGNSHSKAASRLNYTIPLYVWGPTVTPGADLYAINSGVRLNPGISRPNYSAAVQPIRNSDGANLALDLLGLGAIPGSTVNAAQDLAVQGAAPRPPETIAHCVFNEATIGVRDYAKGSGGTELGFTTPTILPVYGSSGQQYAIYTLGTYDSSTSPRRFRMRTTEAEAVFDTVDLSLFDSVTAGIDILLKNTTYEANDYYRAALTNGTDTIYLANVQGTALNALTKDTFLNYSVQIPDSWMQATLKISSHTNSSADDEQVDFDHIFLHGHAGARAGNPLPPCPGGPSAAPPAAGVTGLPQP